MEFVHLIRAYSSQMAIFSRISGTFSNIGCSISGMGWISGTFSNIGCSISGMGWISGTFSNIGRSISGMWWIRDTFSNIGCSIAEWAGFSGVFISILAERAIYRVWE
ncbi:hypothetical protein [Paenibacillus graminis]|uniref:hypothetical protein n=1 Tax=Paenibacillus graminis TaxID=189425 RepID=UPI002DBA0762|nr:hypothetical protein [Paenibacillus graminis]MEC0171876.1 hypothetical protein [Paenibacillus graminis]